MSSINPNNIDGTYPIAGQDNDSQGFRDNFTNIKNNLTFTKSEIEDLQQNVLLKVGLAGTTLDNEMSNAQLKGVQALRFTQTIKDLGALSGTVTVDWQDGHYQILETTGSVTLDFTGWPTSGFYTNLRLEIIIDAASRTVTLPAEITDGLTTTQGAVGQVITFPAAGHYWFEFGTYNNGSNVAIRDLSRNVASGYQYSNVVPGSGSNVTTITNNVGRMIFDPPGTIANHWVNLPSANVDATVITISSTNQMTAVKINPNTGTTVVPSSNVTLSGNSVQYFYHAVESKWYKVG